MRKIFGLSLFMAAVFFVAMSFMPKADGLTYNVGDTASDFKLMSTQKTMVSMESYEEANGFIVVFTCNTCPYSVLYEDRIIDLHNKYAEKGFPVIAINPNDPEVKAGDSFEAMMVRAEEKKFPFAYLFDEGQKVYPDWGATRTPHAFVLNKERVIKYIGAIDDSPRDAKAVTVNYIDTAIEAIVNGKDPEPSFTKAIGCSIKTKDGGTMQKSLKKKRKSE